MCEDTCEFVSLVEDRDYVERLAAVLLPREADVIQRRFFAYQTLAEVGTHYGITSARVRQIEQRALRRLRAQAAQLRVPIDYDLRDISTTMRVPLQLLTVLAKASKESPFFVRVWHRWSALVQSEFGVNPIMSAHSVTVVITNSHDAEKARSRLGELFHAALSAELRIGR